MNVENAIVKPIVEAIVPKMANLFDADIVNNWMLQSSLIDCGKAFISAQSEIAKVGEENQTERSRISANRDVSLAAIEKQKCQDEQRHQQFMCGRKEIIAQLIRLTENAVVTGDVESSKLHSQQFTAILLNSPFTKE